MQDPKKLKVRGEALKLAVAAYRLTAAFPTSERFGLASQMQRAAVSVGSNISEGCGGHGDRAMIAYLHHAIGSLNELEFQVEIAIELMYGTADLSLTLQSQLNTVRRMAIGLVTTLRRRSVPDV
jgi:four helix bundle protein